MGRQIAHNIDHGMAVMKHWNRIEPILWYFSFVLIFLIILIGNTVTPYLIDDYNLAIVRGEKAYTALYAGVKNAANNWNNWGGSFFPGVVDSFFMNYDKTVFNIANSFALVLLVYLMHLIMDISKKQRLVFLWALVLGFLSFVPVPGQTLLWLVGSGAYLWPLVIVLLYLAPLSLYDTERNKSIMSKVGMFVCPIIGLVAGNSHGAVGGVCVLVSIMYLVKWALERRRIPLWAYVGSLFASIGCALMVFAPGNYKRLNVAENFNLVSRIVVQMLIILQSQGVMAIILMTGLLFYVKYAKHNKLAFSIDNSLIYGSGALMGLASLLIVPAAERAFLFFPCFAVIAIGMMCKGIHFDKYMVHLVVALLLALWMNVTMTYSTLFVNAYRCKQFIDWRAVYIRHEVADHKDVITVPSLTDHEIYRRLTGNLSDINESPDSWVNLAFARFHGAKKIIGQPFRSGFEEARRLYEQ